MVDSERKRRVSEDIWLSYYNRTLFKSGVITELEHNKMAAKIAARSVVSLC